MIGMVIGLMTGAFAERYRPHRGQGAIGFSQRARFRSSSAHGGSRKALTASQLDPEAGRDGARDDLIRRARE